MGHQSVLLELEKLSVNLKTIDHENFHIPDDHFVPCADPAIYECLFGSDELISVIKSSRSEEGHTPLRC